MHYKNHSHVESALRVGQWPWLAFLLLAAVFFFCQHDLFYSQKVNESFNLSQSEVLSTLDGGTLSREIALVFLTIFSVASLSRRRDAQFRMNGWLGVIMLFYAGLAVVSLLWAEDAALTLKRLMLFVILGLAATAIARRFTMREIILGICFATGIYLLIGISAEIVLGNFHPFASGYRFAGTLHPNHQGINCGLLLLSAVTAANMEQDRKKLFRACAAFGFVFLVLTGSRTSFAATMAGLAVYFGAVCSKRTKILATLAFGTAFSISLVVGAGALIPGLKDAAMLGRNNVNSFDGRTEIWQNLGYYIDQHPILGYGYGGFWTDRHITDLTSVVGTTDFGVAESHNAYLECLLSLGFVGLTAYVLLLLGGIARSFALYRASKAPAFAFSGAFLIFCVVNGFLESAIVSSTILIFLSMATLIELGFQNPMTEYRSRIRTTYKQAVEVLS